MTNTIFNLAEAPDNIYELLQQLYKKYAVGGLKDLTLKSSEKSSGAPVCKPGHFKDFVKIKDKVCQAVMLREVVAGKKTLKEFSDECLDIKRRQNTQGQFLRETGCQSWEEAEERYPIHTSLEAVDRFHGVNFKKGAPHAWNEHVKGAKQHKEAQGMIILEVALVLPRGC